MPIVEYKPEYFGALSEFVTKLGNTLGMAHRPFVDYYYGTKDWCKLYLYVGDDGNVMGTYGLERMLFEYDHRELTIGFGGNFYSIQPGVGGLLFLYGHNVCPIGLVFGGSTSTHRLIRSRQWTFYRGVQVYILNDEYPARAGEGVFLRAMKSVARRVARARLSKYESRIPQAILKQISVHEEKEYTRDLLTFDSPFFFRFAPTLDYLSWRYNTSLTFVRYRLFRILHRGRTAGYTVINEGTAKMIVAHCDGVDAEVLAYGIIRSILAVAREDHYPRCAILSSCHPQMQNIFQRLGFVAEPAERPFCMGTLKGPVNITPDTSSWLVNYDWGDNGLRPPFLD
jgi:hypothetical protein